MLTSDDIVVPCARYVFVVDGADGEEVVLDVHGESYALLLESWRDVEIRKGKRLTFEEFLKAARETLMARCGGSRARASTQLEQLVIDP
jgi:hypothetical protein